MKRVAFVIGVVALLLVMASTTSPVLAATPTFDKNSFHNPLNITNKYFPLKPGTTLVYEGTSERLPTRSTVAVTDRTKTILGIKARVVVDTVWVNGKLVEQTEDWFAQDDAGNVWYMGEWSTDYKNGKVVDHHGSWEAGVNGAQPGIMMLARPKVGQTYRQEFAKGIAEDMATVLSLNESIRVPYGSYSNVLKTKDFTPLEPDVVEHKYYASGVGLIKVVMVKGGAEESYLVRKRTGQ